MRDLWTAFVQVFHQAVHTAFTAILPYMLFDSEQCLGWQGNINLIEAAAKKGVKKFVLVTSIGTGDSKDAPPGQVYDVLKPVLLEKEKAEEALKVISCY